MILIVSNHYFLYLRGGICDSWAKENYRMLLCLKTQTQNLDLSGYLTKQRGWIVLSVDHVVFCTLVLAGKSPMTTLFMGVLLILLGPSHNSCYPETLPEYPSPGSYHSSEQSLWYVYVGHNSTIFTYCLIDLTNCFVNLVSPPDHKVFKGQNHVPSAASYCALWWYSKLVCWLTD